jgi:hypothetical protein
MQVKGSDRSRDSFDSVDFQERNKTFNVKELYSNSSLFTYLRETQNKPQHISRNNLLTSIATYQDTLSQSTVLPAINPRYWKQYETFDRAMIDTKITYKDSPNAPKKEKGGGLSDDRLLKSSLKKKEEISIEKMIRKPNKLYF